MGILVPLANFEPQQELGSILIGGGQGARGAGAASRFAVGQQIHQRRQSSTAAHLDQGKGRVDAQLSRGIDRTAENRFELSISRCLCEKTFLIETLRTTNLCIEDLFSEDLCSEDLCTEDLCFEDLCFEDNVIEINST